MTTDTMPARTGRPVDPAPTTGVAGVLYEAVMITLAVTVIVLLPRADVGAVRVANLVIWGIFVIDYFTRLALSGDRRRFLRRNVIDLVAILPADFFRAARALRVVRVLRLLRATVVLWRVSAVFRGILSTNGLGWVLIVTGTVVLLGAGAVLAVEPEMGGFLDALWWSIVTSTTVGYGDLAPETVVGRVVAVVLMLVGIGALGMITGSIATYFVRAEDTPTNPHVEHLKDILDRWDTLTIDQRHHAAQLLQLLVYDTAGAGTETD